MIQEIAAAKKCTASQTALAWVMEQGDYIFPIPGTKRVKYLEENSGAPDVVLTLDDLAMIDAFFPKDVASGTRYPASVIGWLNK